MGGLDDGTRIHGEIVHAAKREVLFREVNERIHELGASASNDQLAFVCECADLRCVELMTMTHAEYRLARSHPLCFIVLPGHVNEKAERVVGATRRFLIVQKTGVAGDLVEALAGAPESTRNPGAANACASAEPGGQTPGGSPG